MSLHATRARAPAVASGDDVHWSRLGRCGPATADCFTRSGVVLSRANVHALELCEFCPVKTQCAANVLGWDRAERRMLIAGGLVFNEGGLVVEPPMPRRRDDPLPRPPRECGRCGNPFTGMAHQRYCSVACRKALHDSLRLQRTYHYPRQPAVSR